MPTLGDFIKARREELDLTQEEVEERTSLSQNYISQVELGKIKHPRDDKLGLFARGLELEPAVLRAVAAGLEPAEPAEDLVPVRHFGRVPADAVRWVAAEEEGLTVSVPPRWFGGRPHTEFFTVQASGDCLLQKGIASGNHVLAHRLYQEEPRRGEIVVVLLNGERSLKIWDRDGRAILLRDGYDRVVQRVNPEYEDITPLGRYVTHWHEPAG